MCGGRGLVRLSLKNVFMDKKYVYIRSLHGPLFFASRDLKSREIADNVLAHGVPASLVTIGCADREASTVRFRCRPCKIILNCDLERTFVPHFSLFFQSDMQKSYFKTNSLFRS